MSRKSRVWLAVLASTALAAGLAVFLYQPKERLYQGRRAEEWFTELNRPLDEAEIQRWKDLGPDAVPLLTKALGAGVGILDRTYAKFYPHLPGRVQKRWGRPVDMFRVRSNAAIILGKLGPGAATAAPALARSLRDPDPNTRVAAVQTLTLLMPDAAKYKSQMLPEFVRAMKDTNWLVREHAASFLAGYREASRVAAPALIKALDDPQVTVRTRAYAGLNQMDFTAVSGRQVAPLLIQCTKSREPTVRATAASKLGLMNKEPRQSVPALSALLSDPEAVVRYAAATALGRFGPEAKSAVPALVKTLDAPELVVRLAATNALAKIEPSKWTLPAPIAHE
jgi:HEAT repeat protein